MKNTSISTPIVLLVYKRLSSIKSILEVINQVGVEELFIVADGPKNAKESVLCADVISYIRAHHKAKKIRFNIAKNNMGLRDRVISGLNWVFSKVDQAIIIEDDCVPDPSFFPFTEELLAKYAKDKRVISIGGFTSHSGIEETSYVFSKFIESWGWATWKRAWSLFDKDLKSWPDLRKTKWLERYLGNRWAAHYWKLVFDDTFHYRPNSWAYRWMYTAFRHKGLTIFPTVNLIHNIGFDKHATHTKVAINLPERSVMQFPLIHPEKVEVSSMHDNAYNKKLLKNPITILGLFKSMLFHYFGIKK